MSGPERIMIPPLLDQEGRPSHRKRNAALLGFILLLIALVVFLLVG
jgi:hypothetical protein